MADCPCCGQPIPPDIHLSPIQRRIYELVKRFPGISRTDLTSRVYADDPTGGPDSDNVISVHAYQINRRLKPHGLILRAVRGYGYHIERLDPDYDADLDFERSINACYEAIRERVANGGLGWEPK